MKEELSWPKLDKARPTMPVDCSDTAALILEDGSLGMYSDHERLEHGRALYRKLREQIAREAIVVESKRNIIELDSPTQDGLSGPTIQRRRERVKSGERCAPEHPYRDADTQQPPEPVHAYREAE